MSKEYENITDCIKSISKIIALNKKLLDSHKERITMLEHRTRELENKIQDVTSMIEKMDKDISDLSFCKCKEVKDNDTGREEGNV